MTLHHSTSDSDHPLLTGIVKNKAHSSTVRETRIVLATWKTMFVRRRTDSGSRGYKTRSHPDCRRSQSSWTWSSPCFWRWFSPSPPPWLRDVSVYAAIQHRQAQAMPPTGCSLNKSWTAWNSLWFGEKNLNGGAWKLTVYRAASNATKYASSRSLLLSRPIFDATSTDSRLHSNMSPQSNW